MIFLKFVDDQWGLVGSFNWFVIYGIFMSCINFLISGDNKGVVVRLMEDWFEQREEFVLDEIFRRVLSIIGNYQDSRKFVSEELLEIVFYFEL